jgi:hypothetical protein
MDESHVSRIINRPYTRRRALRAGGMSVSAAMIAAVTAGAGVAAQTGSPTPDLLAPAGSPAASPAAVPAWDEIDRRLAALAPQTALLTAELVGQEIRPIHAFHADVRLGVGSSFKLYILGELSRQVAAKQVAWEEPLRIEARYKSVPGGDMRFVPDGTIFNVLYFAERMMTTMGMSDPAANIPLLSTREFALLKLAYPADKRDAYLTASVAERRVILATVIDQMPDSALDTVENQTGPVEVERVEWFATREDLARAMLYLQTAARQPELRPVTEVISLETQLMFDAKVWPYVGFKGGSEAGLLSGTWLLERADQRHFVYTIGFVNPKALLDLDAIVPVMEAARDRLATTP